MEPTEINEASSRTERNSVITKSGEILLSRQPREILFGVENCVVSLQHPAECVYASPERDSVCKNEMNVVEK